MQAPRRDEESKIGWKPVRQAMEEAAAEDQPRALCKALEFLLERVNAMRIDAANARCLPPSLPLWPERKCETLT